MIFVDIKLIRFSFFRTRFSICSSIRKFVVSRSSLVNQEDSSFPRLCSFVDSKEATYYTVIYSTGWMGTLGMNSVKKSEIGGSLERIIFHTEPFVYLFLRTNNFSRYSIFVIRNLKNHHLKGRSIFPIIRRRRKFFFYEYP